MTALLKKISRAYFYAPFDTENKYFEQLLSEFIGGVTRCQMQGEAKMPRQYARPCATFPNTCRSVTHLAARSDNRSVCRWWSGQ